MLGSYVSAAYRSAPSKAAENFFAALLEWAGVESPFAVSGSPLEIRALESGRDLLLFAFNHRKEKASASIRFAAQAPSVKAIDFLSGKAVPLSAEGARVRLDVSLDPLGVSVYRITR